MNDSNLAKVLVEEAVVLDCEPFESKEAMFDFMAERFVKAKIVTNKEAYIKALYEREELGPTYMGSQIGLPHGKCDEVVTPGIGFCRCKDTFTYKSCGEEGKVKYVFMLAIAGTQSGDQYMRTLANLAGLLTHDDFLRTLDECKSYEELINKINEYDR